MRIGIDISQIVYEGTGVKRYVEEIVRGLLQIDKENEYILFGASLRQYAVFRRYFQGILHLSKKVRLVTVPLPPTVLDIIWNKLHILPVEWFTGPLDIFWSSDWTQPPLVHAKGVTTIHDVSFLKFPENFAEKIITIQKRRLAAAQKNCRMFFCDSEATRLDAKELLGIHEDQLKVVYPGFSL